jgi:group I intron endonuclease
LKTPDFSFSLCSFIPLITYSNLDTDKSTILSDNKGKTGIYKIMHIESGKFYIGSVVNLSIRLKMYYSKNHLNRDKTMYIHIAIFQHGHSAFFLSILEYIDITNLSKEAARQLIFEREQHFFDSLGPEYNIQKIANSSLG